MEWIKERVAKFKLDLHNIFGFTFDEKTTAKFLMMRKKGDYRYPSWTVLKELKGPYRIESLPKPQDDEEIIVAKVSVVIVRRLEEDV